MIASWWRVAGEPPSFGRLTIEAARALDRFQLAKCPRIIAMDPSLEIWDFEPWTLTLIPIPMLHRSTRNPINYSKYAW